MKRIQLILVLSVLSCATPKSPPPQQDAPSPAPEDALILKDLQQMPQDSIFLSAEAEQRSEAKLISSQLPIFYFQVLTVPTGRRDPGVTIVSFLLLIASSSKPDDIMRIREDSLIVQPGSLEGRVLSLAIGDINSDGYKDIVVSLSQDVAGEKYDNYYYQYLPNDAQFIRLFR